MGREDARKIYGEMTNDKAANAEDMITIEADMQPACQAMGQHSSSMKE